MAYVDKKLQVDRLNEEAASLERSSPGAMLERAIEAQSLAEAISYQAGAARGASLRGKAMMRLGRLHEADRLLSSIQGLDELPTEQRADAHNIKGVIALYLKQYDRAFAHYWDALYLARAIPDPELTARLLNNIGEIYRYNRDFLSAADYYRQSIEIYSGLPPETIQSVPVANMAITHMELGEYEIAESFAWQALRISQEQDDRMITSASYHYLGVIHARRGQLEEAAGFLGKALVIYRETEEALHTAETLIELHLVAVSRGDYEEGYRLLQSALSIACECADYHLQALVYAHHIDLFSAQGQHSKALEATASYRQALAEVEKEEHARMLRAVEVQINADRTMRQSETYRLLNEQLQSKAAELEGAYQTLAAISEMGREITSTQNLESIFQRTHARLKELMVADAFGVAIYEEAEQGLVYSYLVEDDIPLGEHVSSIDSPTSLAVACFKKGEGFIINTGDEDLSHLIDGRGMPQKGADMSATMFQPLIMDGQTVGIVSVQSHQPQVYDQRTLDTLGLLASYLAIAIQNARRSQQLQELNSELSNLSNRDGLTGIANRRRFDQFLSDSWYAAMRRRQEISLLLIDTDCLKQYNDHYGHLAGDEVIKRISEAVSRSVQRRTDLAARYGGDEFVVVLGDTGAEGALHAANRIREFLERAAIRHDASPIRPQVTVSIGVATLLPEQDDLPATLIQICDQALYQAKQAGRDQIAVAT